MGTVASAVVALSRRQHVTNLNFARKKTRHEHKFFLNDQWLNVNSPSILPHINARLLHAIYTKINNRSVEKERTDPESKKAYITLLHTLDSYQQEAQTILIIKENIKFRISLLFFSFCISLFLSILIPPIAVITFLFFAGLAHSSYSVYKLREKHPNNESELELAFKNFEFILEKSINYGNDNREFQPDNSNEFSLTRKKASINVTRLKKQPLFFKDDATAEESNTITIKKGEVFKPPQQP